MTLTPIHAWIGTLIGACRTVIKSVISFGFNKVSNSLEHLPWNELLQLVDKLLANLVR